MSHEEREFYEKEAEFTGSGAYTTGPANRPNSRMAEVTRHARTLAERVQIIGSKLASMNARLFGDQPVAELPDPGEDIMPGEFGALEGSLAALSLMVSETENELAKLEEQS